MSHPQVWPVIHLHTPEAAMENARIAFEHGAQGVFVIHMDGWDDHIDPVALAIKARWPELKVGVNYLSLDAERALERSIGLGMDATWTDAPGVRSDETSPMALRISQALMAHPEHDFFASVAFKYQRKDPNPGQAALQALALGMIPTTSGEATGKAPAESKIALIREVIGQSPLALASGIDPDNVGSLGAYLTHLLVATGISKTFYAFDEDKVAALMKALPAA